MLAYCWRRNWTTCADLIGQGETLVPDRPSPQQGPLEAAELLGVSTVTVKRRLSRGLRLLAEQLADLRPGEDPPESI